jgi:hypothetical protein
MFRLHPSVNMTRDAHRMVDVYPGSYQGPGFSRAGKVL